jgi:Glycopeptide antibiotics resistance protein
MRIFNATINRIFGGIIDSPLRIIYIFVCMVILCVVFQIFILSKATKKADCYLSPKHFILVYIFLLYLSFVFQEVGIGTLWIIGRYETMIRFDEIQLIPFADFGVNKHLKSILSDILNIIMTIPFGFFLPLIWTEFRSIKKVALTGFVFSFFIELSQLLNRRATTVDDLIMNTLGAIIGYLIFKIIYKIFVKIDDLKITTTKVPAIIRNEAIIYLACAFMGVFILYNPSQTLPFDVSSEEAVKVDIVDTDLEGMPTGLIIEISDEALTVEGMELWRFGRKLTIGNTGEVETIILTDDTIVEIWQTDATGALESLISIESKDGLSLRDAINVYGESDESGMVAEKIIVWKYE